MKRDVSWQSPCCRNELCFSKFASAKLSKHLGHRSSVKVRRGKPSLVHALQALSCVLFNLLNS